MNLSMKHQTSKFRDNRSTQSWYNTSEKSTDRWTENRRPISFLKLYKCIPRGSICWKPMIFFSYCLNTKNLSVVNHFIKKIIKWQKEHK